MKKFRRILVQKAVQGFGFHLINYKKKKLVHGFGVKSWIGFWWRNLRKILVEKAVQGFGAKSCAGFCCRKLCSVLVQKATQGFSVKSSAGFCCKKLCKVLL